MPSRTTVAKELSAIFAVLAHPDRLRIVAELKDGEKDVNTLEGAIGISHSRVSQHLANLKAHRLVGERRDGRHVFYHLTQPAMAQWLVEGLQFVEGETAMADRIRTAVEEARQLWSSPAE